MPVSPSPQTPRNSVRQKKDGTPAKTKATPDKKAPAKPVDFGKAIGINKPANVKDKIRKWQAELDPEDLATEDVGDTVPNNEEVAPAPSPKPRATSKPNLIEDEPSPRPGHTPTKSVELPERPKSARKPAHNKLDDDVRHASAPKKRIVSDSNWRTKKSPPKDANGRLGPKPVNAWVRPSVKPRSEPKPAPDLSPLLIFTPKINSNDVEGKTRSAPRTKQTRPSSAGNDTRRSSGGSASATEVRSAGDACTSPTSTGSGEKVKIIRRVRRRRRSGGSESHRSSISADDMNPTKPKFRSTRNSHTPPVDDLVDDPLYEKKSPRLNDLHDEGTPRKRRSHRRRERDLNSPDDLTQEVSSGERRHSRRKSQHHNAEAGALERSSPPPNPEASPKVFGSRLEAWLSSTPDPFVDAHPRARRPSKETISTSDVSSRQLDRSDVSGSTITKTTTTSVSDDIIEPRSSTRRRARTRGASIKIETDTKTETESSLASTSLVEEERPKDDGDTTPTMALRRRGARRATISPTKDRIKSSPLRESVARDEEDVASSAPSSSVDASAIDLNVLSNTRHDSLPMRRVFPSTGKRLSTIVSVETFGTKIQEVSPSEAPGAEEVTEAKLQMLEGAESHDKFNPDTLTTLSRKSTKKSRLASHADLISVLSMPKAGTRSIMSARSIRTNRSRLATATIGDIMDELASDEIKYMRELRTLVDGVIPVLLSCVLSKSDSAVAAGLFSRSASKSDPSSITKPIIDMGIALERLKGLHKRVPKDDADSFVSWTQSAQRVYSEYIQSWRLGFQDVVVSLAPAEDDSRSLAKTLTGPNDGTAWDEGLPRNEEGYVVNGDGERVDVAYMLKRPLVRLKYLSKTLKGINHVKPSENAAKMSDLFQQLVNDARKRSNEERARLEDEAAANIDPTRARDPRSLAPLTGVRVDPHRCVRARDYFDMHLIHSSGQEVNCRVELLLRDDAPGHGNSGDILLCEVEPTSRWLFFPPIQLGRISARNGDLQGEIVVMVRGLHSDGKEWSEIFSLRTDDEQAGFEWVQMLGLMPIPPQLADLKREQSLVNKTPRPASSHASSSLVSATTASTPPQKSRTPSPHEIEIPIGEQANPTSKRWGYETPDAHRTSREDVSPVTPPSSDSSRLKKARANSLVSPPFPVNSRSPAEDGVYSHSTRPSSRDENGHHDKTPRSLNEAMMMAGTGSPTNLKRTKAKRLSKPAPQSPSSPQPSRQIVLEDPPVEEPKPVKKLSKRHRSEQPHKSASSSLSQSSKGFSVWLPTSEPESSDESDDDYPVRNAQETPKRPGAHRRATSVPTMDLPTIPKLRKASQPSTPVKERSSEETVAIPEAPSSAPSKLEKKNSEPKSENMEDIDDDDKPPPVPPHRSPSPGTPVTLKASNTPNLTPTLPAYKTRRRSSSPLKHEYEPSTASESSSESEEDYEESLTSESSEDELHDDVPTPLMPIGQRNKFPKVSPPSSIYTLPNDTLTPSQSASNTPYRTVPQGSEKAAKAIASVLSWSNTAGRYDNLHPDECSVVVTPGKIEVFELTAAHSKPFLADGDEIINPSGKPPLIAMELTPLVLVRKGTALDISFRSPPTPDSRIKDVNNIMLRSRSPGECEALYGMINWARINNPTYIALQNARGPYGQSNWAEAMDRQNAARSTAGSSNSWLNFAGTLGRRSSYRKSSTRAASISAATESSVGTMNTAIKSALNRFSFNKNGRFNIKGSTLSSRDGSQSTNSFNSSNSGGSGASSPNPDSGRAPGAPPGITNSKVRLYERETQSKWRDMGSARLSIMLPDPNAPQSIMRQGQGSPGVRNLGQEKRILIIGKSKGGTLLDVTLGESCFERVARTGIAVSVWEDVLGPNGEVGTVGAIGGVSGARARVYMIQMKTEREAAFSFNLLGKHRY